MIPAAKINAHRKVINPSFFQKSGKFFPCNSTKIPGKVNEYGESYPQPLQDLKFLGEAVDVSRIIFWVKNAAGALAKGDHPPQAPVFPGVFQNLRDKPLVPPVYPVEYPHA
jgi:hypothetical protein